ncbi:unnamed protein product, partial [Brassica rapa subsp. narinosa]
MVIYILVKRWIRDYASVGMGELAKSHLSRRSTIECCETDA